MSVRIKFLSGQLPKFVSCEVGLMLDLILPDFNPFKYGGIVS